MALTNEIVFWTGEKNLYNVDWIMRNSALLKNPDRVKKWDERHYSDGTTYGQKTIQKVLEGYSTKKTYPEILEEIQTKKDYSKEDLSYLDKEITKEELIELEENCKEKTKPTINIQNGERSIVAKKIASLFSYGNIFKSNGKLVNLKQCDYLSPMEKKKKNFSNSQGVKIEILDKPKLWSLCTDYCILSKWNERKEVYVQTDLSKEKEISDMILNEGTYPKVRFLKGISVIPLITAEGRIITKQGYDYETSMYFDMENFEFEKIDIDEAKKIIDEVIEEFPFVDEIDKSTAISYILSTFIRPNIKTCPLCCVTANIQGVGKSHLQNIPSFISTGEEQSSLNWEKNQDEFKKKIFSKLLQRPQFIMIDNVNNTLFNNDFFNSLLTQEFVEDRILGISKTESLSTNTLISMGGNHLSLTGDMIRRSIFCRLHTDLERPQERKFKKAGEDFIIFIKENRTRIINSCLSILKTQCKTIEMGKDIVKKKGLSHLIGYEEWSKIVRGAVINVWKVDPVESQKNLEEEDEYKINATRLLTLWYELIGEKYVETIDVINTVKPYYNEDGIYETGKGKTKELYDTICEVTGVVDGNIKTRSFTNWLKKNEGVNNSGLMLEKKQPDTKGLNIKWRVKNMNKKTDTTTTLNFD